MKYVSNTYRYIIFKEVSSPLGIMAGFYTVYLTSRFSSEGRRVGEECCGACRCVWGAVQCKNRSSK